MHHKDMPIITAKHCLSCFLYFRSAVPPLLVVRDSPSILVELYFNRRSATLEKQRKDLPIFKIERKTLVTVTRKDRKN